MENTQKTQNEMLLDSYEEEAISLSEVTGAKTETSEFLNHLSDVYAKIADLKMKVGGEHSIEDAVEAYRWSIKYKRKELKVHYDKKETENLVRLYDKMGNIYYKAGTHEALELAAQAYEMGATQKENLYIYEKNSRYEAELAIIYEKIGNIYYIFGDKENLNRAVDAYERSLRYKREIYHQNSTRTNLSNIASSEFKIGQIYYRLGGSYSYRKALSSFRNVLDYNEQMAKQEDEPVNRKNLAGTYYNIGKCYAKLGNPENIASAIESFKQSITLRLASKDDSVPTQSALASTYTRLADILIRSGDINDRRDALSGYDEALKIYNKIADTRENYEDERNISSLYYHIGNAHLLVEDEGYIEDALEAFKKSVEYREMNMTNHDNEENKKLLSLTYNRMGYTYFLAEGEESIDHAVECYQKSVNINKELINLGVDVDYKQMSSFYVDLAQSLTLRKDKDEMRVIKAYEYAAFYLNKYLEIEDTPEEETELAAIYNQIGNNYHDLKNYKKALEMYSESLGVNLDLTKAHKDLSLLMNLAISYGNLGTTYQAMGDDYLDAAVKAFNKCGILNHRLRYESFDEVKPLEKIETLIGKGVDRVILLNSANQHIFLVEDIPAKKVKNALENYGKDIEESYIVAIYDHTRFHNYKSGTLFTRRGIYSSYLPENTIIRYEAIENIERDNNTLIFKYYGDHEVRVNFDKYAKNLYDTIDVIINGYRVKTSTVI